MLAATLILNDVSFVLPVILCIVHIMDISEPIGKRQYPPYLCISMLICIAMVGLNDTFDI